MHKPIHVYDARISCRKYTIDAISSLFVSAMVQLIGFLIGELIQISQFSIRFD
jgi:hypothetical protein